MHTHQSRHRPTAKNVEAKCACCQFIRDSRSKCYSLTNEKTPITSWAIFVLSSTGIQENWRYEAVSTYQIDEDSSVSKKTTMKSIIEVHKTESLLCKTWGSQVNWSGRNLRKNMNKWKFFCKCLSKLCYQLWQISNYTGVQSDSTISYRWAPETIKYKYVTTTFGSVNPKHQTART